MNGKGDRNRTTDRNAYNRGWERIFGGNIDSTKAETFSDVGAIPTSSTIEKTDWMKVCFAVDVCERDSDTNELTDYCTICGLNYCDSPCPGPTEDGWEYEERSTGMWARKIPEERTIETKPFKDDPIGHGIKYASRSVGKNIWFLIE
jgi:hypothetical protein